MGIVLNGRFVRGVFLKSKLEVKEFPFLVFVPLLAQVSGLGRRKLGQGD